MRSRLLLSKCYMVGPMDRDREGGRAWRADLEPWLISLGVIPLNPYEKPLLEGEGLEDDENFELVGEAIKGQDYDEVTRLMKPIRNIDLRLVDECSFIFAYLDLDKNPCGSYEEIYLANRQRKPIIIVCPQNKENIPPWLFAVLPHQMMFDRIGDAKTYLERVAYSPKVETFDRWRFFDLFDVTAEIIQDENARNFTGNYCPNN